MRFLKFLNSFFIIRRIKREGAVAFDQKATALKKRILHDTSISYEKIDEEYTKGLAVARQENLQEINAKIEVVLKNLQTTR